MVLTLYKRHSIIAGCAGGFSGVIPWALDPRIPPAQVGFYPLQSALLFDNARDLLATKMFTMMGKDAGGLPRDALKSRFSKPVDGVVLAV